jgi:hypothetical protein
MKTIEDIGKLEKLIGQLNGLYAELTLLAKKSPNDGLNVFKLKVVNGILLNANGVLPEDYRPIDGFDSFDEQAIPTNSDAALVLAQYLEQVERFRSANLVRDDRNHRWVYLIDGAPSAIGAKPPTKVGGQRE